MAQPYRNGAYGSVFTAPSPATSGTTLVLGAGQGALFPDPASVGNYPISIWPAGSVYLGGSVSGHGEICTVTALSSNTLTITRAAESSTARAIVVGDQVAQAITAAMFANLKADSLALPAWTAYTPVAAGSGTPTITSYTATGRYLLMGKTLFINVSIAITTVGSATGGLTFTLPLGLVGATALQYIAGRENAVTGSTLQGQIAGGSNVAIISTYNNGGTLSNGWTSILTGVVEVA